MKPIHQEHFEHWLFSQPDDRTWAYAHCEQCLVASFLKEQGICKTPSVSSNHYRDIMVPFDSETRFEPWLSQMMNRDLPILLGSIGLPATITAKRAKDYYLSHFKDKNHAEPTPTRLEDNHARQPVLASPA